MVGGRKERWERWVRCKLRGRDLSGLKIRDDLSTSLGRFRRRRRLLRRRGARGGRGGRERKVSLGDEEERGRWVRRRRRTFSDLEGELVGCCSSVGEGRSTKARKEGKEGEKRERERRVSSRSQFDASPNPTPKLTSLSSPPYPSSSASYSSSGTQAHDDLLLPNFLLLHCYSPSTSHSRTIDSCSLLPNSTPQVSRSHSHPSS